VDNSALDATSAEVDPLLLNNGRNKCPSFVASAIYVILEIVDKHTTFM
jgi:hypothetical protein